MLPFSIEHFIAKHITLRPTSLFAVDLASNHQKLAAEIDGKSILVIGGAGTIGSSFVKAALKFAPKRLFVLDINENGLTELTRDLRSSIGYNIPEDYKTYPIDFGDPVFTKLLQREGPFDIVANFAAHKHVRSEKDHYSIEAMIENNVLRAKNLLDQLTAQKPAHFFCVSTDKAANPVNVMGASKKLMEEVILAYSATIPITTARFANVAFSNGSLLAGFLERMMKRQPLSAPQDVKRYFVSPEESGQLCLLACILGKSGEIFFPKLGAEQMLTFSEIATQFLLELGYQPDFCQSEQEAKEKAAALTPNSATYPVYYFGSDTSGEKSFEEFYTEGEAIALDRFSQLGVIENAPKRMLADIDRMFLKLRHLFEQNELDKSAVVQLLQEFIPNFEHIETGKSLDQKM